MPQSQMRCVRRSIALIGLCILLGSARASSASGSSGLKRCEGTFASVSPQYQGKLTARLNPDRQTVDLFTSAEGIPQGNTGSCKLIIPPTGSGFQWQDTTTLEAFQKMTALELQGACVQIAEGLDRYFSPPKCTQGAFFKVISAENLQFNLAKDAFTVDVVLEEVNPKPQ